MTDLLDSDRYPLDRLDTPDGLAFLEACRRELAEEQALALPGFVTPQALAEMLAEAQLAKPSGHRMDGRYTAYSDDMSAADDPALAEDDPRRLRLPASHRFVAGDRISEDSPLRRVYQDARLIALLVAALEVPELHPLADPLGCLNLLIYEPGDRNGWHFDSNDFVVSILLQGAERGGAYHYVPNLRSDDDPNLEAVSHYMRQGFERGDAREATLQPGTLFLFKGRYTLHRVTPVEGDGDRIVAILSYDRAAGHVLSDGTKQALYGRVG
jgi:hypothetical protein